MYEPRNVVLVCDTLWNVSHVHSCAIELPSHLVQFDMGSVTLHLPYTIHISWGFSNDNESFMHYYSIGQFSVGLEILTAVTLKSTYCWIWGSHSWDYEVYLLLDLLFSQLWLCIPLTVAFEILTVRLWRALTFGLEVPGTATIKRACCWIWGSHSCDYEE
jgi:hypothetical protein